MTCPTLRLPDLDEHAAAGKLDFDHQVGAVAAPHRRDRQVAEIGIVVLGALAAVAVDGLHEVALAVEQAHGDERQLEIARRLAVVAGEDAQAARVHRQALVHAELGAEVRHQVLGLEAARVLLERGFRVVGVEGRQDPGHGIEERRIGGGVDQALLVDALEQRLRAVADRVPQRRVQLGEQGARRAIPAVPEVVGQLLQAREALRNARVDLQRVEGGEVHPEGAEDRAALSAGYYRGEGHASTLLGSADQQSSVRNWVPAFAGTTSEI